MKRAGACYGCPLYKNDTCNIIGPEKADIAIIGDSPSASAALRGKPFSGNVEKLIGMLLKNANIDMDDVIMGTVLACAGSRDVKEMALAREMCKDSLIAELSRRGVSKVITFGTEASQVFIDTKLKITQLRVGPPKRSKYGFEVVPTFNPLITFKQGDKLTDLEADFNKFNPARNVVYKDFSYTVIDTESEALEYFDRYTRYKEPVAVDIEVGIEKDISFEHPERYEMICIGVAPTPDYAAVFTAEALKIQSVVDMLANYLKIKNLIMHNGKFDMGGLRPLLGKIKIAEDTLIMSYSIDSRGGIHGLKQLAKEHLNAPDWEKDIPKNKNLHGVDKEIVYKYNAADCVNTYRLRNYFTNHVAYNAELARFLVDLSNALVPVEYNGFKIDLDYSDKMITVFEKTINFRVDSFRAYLNDWDFNPNSPIQVKKALYSMGFELDSTDEAHLNELISHPQVTEEAKEFAEGLLLYRGDAKLLNTYLKGNRDKEYKGRLYPTYLIHGTTTGRLSCRNPNLQNIPRNSPIKKMFVPSHEDWVLTNTDYSQAELRVLCYLAGDKYFRNIFNEEKDPFDDLVPIIYPGTDKLTENPVVWKEKRTMIKTYVYGLSYGRTAYGIAKGFGIPTAVAEGHMRQFWSAIPEIKAYNDGIKKKIENGETLVTPFGRKRSFPMVSRENYNNVMNEGLAFTPQSTASDLCCRALIKTVDDFEKFGLEAKVVNIVHDAIMCDAPKWEADLVTKIVEKNMLESAHMLVGDYVKFAVESSTGKNWGELK